MGVNGIVYGNPRINNNGLEYIPKYQNILFGTKQTGVDAGSIGECYYDDDYFYLCTTGGIVGVAIWKKFTLMNT